MTTATATKLLSTLVLALASTLACASDENQPPGNDDQAEETGDGDGDPGDGDGDPGDGDGDSGDGDGDGDGDPGDGDGDDCVEDPVTPIELLNGCTEANCEPFPVTQDRLPLLEDDGTLPPLP